MPEAQAGVADGGSSAAGLASESGIDAGIDTSAALVRLGGNRRLLTVLLEKFVEEFAGTPAQLAAAIGAGNTEQAALLVHKVKGAAGNLSMGQLHRCSGILELQLRSAPDQAAPALAAFDTALATVLDAARAADPGDR